ncbi:uncharacterized protein [Porites lutea]|uniref:uncharacterized protein n=1 Tax=Porites lutea TaxID=51062 RepID=UPI003CC6BF8F
MIKLALFLACLSVIDGRIIVRVIREADVNATASDLTNATAKPSHDPPELSEFQSDLVAPASGTKPLEAKYTIRVKPKLKDGVPQIQEIRIMPPKSNATKGFVKPLMVLKQNVTRPMIENIEIDVPEKGKKFSSKPSVEVIEGDHKELLEVTKGEATVENPAQQSETKLQDQNDNTAASNSLNATDSFTSQNATKPSTYPNATVSSTSQDAPANSSTTSTQTAAVSQSTNIQTTAQTQASSSTSESASAVAPPEAPSAASVAAPVASASVASSSTAASPAPAAASDVASSAASPASAAVAPAAAPAVAPASAAVAPAAASSSSPASPAPAAASDVASSAVSAAVAPAAAPAVPAASVPAATAPAEASAAVADPVQAYARAYANVPQSCSDDTRCVVYPENRCGEQWLQTNCRLKCKLCSK